MFFLDGFRPPKGKRPLYKYRGPCGGFEWTFNSETRQIFEKFNFQNKPKIIFLTSGICYQVLTKKLNWVDSALECKSLGGSLANLKTPDENTFVRS